MSPIFATLLAAVLAASPHNALTDVPFRCLDAIEISDDSYRDCRRLTLAYEIYSKYQVTPGQMAHMTVKDLNTATENALTWEIAALHKIEAAAAHERLPVAPMPPTRKVAHAPIVVRPAQVARSHHSRRGAVSQVRLADPPG